MATLDAREKEKEILEAVLAGRRSPAAVAEEVYGTVDARVVNAVRRLLDSVDFNRQVEQARENLTGSAIEAFKRTILRNVEEMKKLATEAEDPRVRFQANKDILDRVGLAPTQKTDLRYSPKDYEKIVEGLIKKDAPAETEAGSE